MNDPIVEQIHKTREAIARRFGNDLHAICEDARQRQAASGRKTVDRSGATETKVQPQVPKKAG